MSTKIKSMFFLFTISFTFVFTSCSNNKLDRDDAKEQIIQFFHYPHKATTGTAYYKFYKDMHVGKYILDHKFQDHLNEFDIIKIENIEKNEGEYSAYGNILLSEKGRSDLDTLIDHDQGAGCFSRQFIFKLGNVEFIEITGIREIEPEKSAQVDFSWKYSNLTNMGKIANKFNPKFNDIDVYQNSVLFIKYDDGWRINLASNFTPGSNVMLE